MNQLTAVFPCATPANPRRSVWSGSTSHLFANGHAGGACNPCPVAPQCHLLFVCSRGSTPDTMSCCSVFALFAWCSHVFTPKRGAVPAVQRAVRVHPTRKTSSGSRQGMHVSPRPRPPSQLRTDQCLPPRAASSRQHHDGNATHHRAAMQRRSTKDCDDGLRHAAQRAQQRRLRAIGERVDEGSRAYFECGTARHHGPRLLRRRQGKT